MKSKNQVILASLICSLNNSYAEDIVTVPRLPEGLGLILEKKDNLKKSFLAKNYTEAAEQATQVMKVDPRDEEIQNIYLVSQFNLNNFKELSAFYKKYESGSGISGLQLKLKAISQAKEGDYSSALRTYRALQAVSMITPEWKAFYHYLIFKIDPKSAFQELQRMSKKSFEATSDTTSGRLHLINGDNEAAIEDFEVAFKKDSQNTFVMEALGDAYFKIKNYDKALLTYNSLLKINPDYSEAKIKVAKIYVKQGYFMDAFKALENDDTPAIVEVRQKISSITNSLLNNPNSRTIAEEKNELTAAVTDGKAEMEGKFIPSDINISINESSRLTQGQSITDISSMGETDLQRNVSTVELNLGAKAKKFALSGTGFNANVDYSTGFAGSLAYRFKPATSGWNAELNLSYAKTTFKDLVGVTPGSISLTESSATVSTNYLIGDFSIGPALMYESMQTTQTRPNTLRGDVSFFNAGAQAAYHLTLSESFYFDIKGSYARNIIASAKTNVVGTVDNRDYMAGSGKLYYRSSPRMDYFMGATYSKTTTTYAVSQTRGTSGAKEEEQDVTFPIGINYTF